MSYWWSHFNWPPGRSILTSRLRMPPIAWSYINWMPNTLLRYPIWRINLHRISWRIVFFWNVLIRCVNMNCLSWIIRGVPSKWSINLYWHSWYIFWCCFPFSWIYMDRTSGGRVSFQWVSWWRLYLYRLSNRGRISFRRSLGRLHIIVRGHSGGRIPLCSLHMFFLTRRFLV